MFTVTLRRPFDYEKWVENPMSRICNPDVADLQSVTSKYSR